MNVTAVERFCDEHTHKVFRNEYIVEHLFSFLSVNDIKNCRLVHRTWMNIGTKILRRKAHVMFDFGAFNIELETGIVRREAAYFLGKYNQMKDVCNYYKENTPENTLISSFTFRGEIKYVPLMHFLEDMASYMTELKLGSGINHEQFDGEKMTIDINPKIPPHLTKLHIQLPPYTQVIFSLCLCFDHLSLAKDISLDNCTIILDTKEKRLSPGYLTVGPNNRFIKNGVRIKFLVNENFDLKLTKEIKLDGKNLILNFTDCGNAKVERIVTLKDITVENWEMCDWKIKKFSLDGIQFLKKNFIEIEELTAKNSWVDLAKIYNPESVQRLYCFKDTRIDDAPFFLPNLVDVTLGCENCVTKLPYFTKNKNISKMWLQSEENHDFAMSVNINDLPDGINPLNLALTTLGIHGEGVYPLKVLYMEEYYSISECLTILAKFRPETFKIYCQDIRTEEDIEDVIELIKSSDSYGRLVIGDFYWNKTNSFNDSVISKYVDNQAEYYVFEGKRGKALTQEEADKEFEC